MKIHRKLLITGLILAFVLAGFFLPVEDIVKGIQGWVADNPSHAFSVFTVCAVIGTLLLLPTSLITMLSGFIFGLSQGFVLVWVAGLLASTAAFLFSRTLARPWIERKIRQKSYFLAIDRAIQRKGFLVVLLTRLVMVLPYPALNYSLGLTRVSLRDYVLATNIGSIPPLFLFVYLGTTVSNITSIINGDVRLEGAELLIALTALAVVVGVVLLIVRTAGKVLREELAGARE